MKLIFQQIKTVIKKQVRKNHMQIQQVRNTING